MFIKQQIMSKMKKKPERKQRKLPTNGMFCTKIDDFKKLKN